MTTTMILSNNILTRRSTDGEVPFRYQSLIGEPVNRAFRIGV